MVMAVAALPAVVSGGPVASAAVPGGDITAVCAGTTSGSVFTLSADCGPTTAPLIVPDGFTVDGAGHTITATDLPPDGSAQWNGGILTNAGSSMNVQNLSILGPVDGFQLCQNSNNILVGIFFNDAGGAVSNVTIEHIFQQQNGAFGSCQTGRAIRADGVSAARTVTISSTVASDYQKTAVDARGTMTMNLSGSTAGPPTRSSASSRRTA
jgi:hypothetical protein